MYISLVYIIMLIQVRLLEVPWAGFATPLATFKDDYDEPSTPTRSAARRRRAWSAFIREMILSDVNIVQGPRENGRSVTYIVVEHRLSGARGRRLAFGPSNFGRGRGRLRFVVNFHNRLSSEIKDEICSKLASALRALKSRISRICGINELERRVSLT